ncbi:MAG: PAS domain S-box protein [Syntrophaceae bacterium]
MKDDSKTKQQLIEEVSQLRQQVEELKKNMAIFADSEHELAAIGNSLQAGIYIIQDGKTMYVNSHIPSYSGYSEEELLNLSLMNDTVHPEDQSLVRECGIKMLKGQDLTPYEYRIITKDGRVKWLMEKVASIQFRGDRAILGNTMDITEKKQMEQKLQQLMADLEIRVQQRTKELTVASDALQESEEFLNSIIENIPDMIFVKDAENLQFVRFNKAGEELLGYTRDELIGKSDYDFFPKNEADFFTAKDRDVLHDKKLIDIPEESIQTNYRGRRILHTKKISILNKKGTPQYLLGISEDITERKKAEAELRQSEAVLRSVFKATPVGLCIMKDRVYQSANATWCESFGYPESEIIGQTTRMLYENDEEYERVGRELYAHLPERGLPSVQTKLRRKDGVFRDAILTAAPLHSEDFSLGTLVAIEDITDRRRIEEELKENRRQLANIIEFLPDATLVIDKEGKVIAWNRAIETMTGIKKEKMIGKGNHEYSIPFYGDRRPILIDLALHPDVEMEKQYTAIQRVGDMLFGEAFTPNLPSGNIHLSATASVLRDEQGEISFVIECIRDNTERKKLEERLHRAEKMEALGTLAGGVAHDLNNVLGILVGYSELLVEKVLDEKQVKKYASNILKSSERGAAIIQDLLTLARRGVAISEIINLNNIVSDYFKTLEFKKLKTYHPNVSFKIGLEKDLMNIKGSPIHLSKTIMNLVSNALEATSDKGEVTIQTGNRYLDEPIRGYDDMREGDYVVLTISDNGKGISNEDIGKIFEPFYTKKVMGRSGTGLGLAVVWGTVKDHNGYIDVQSKEGEGSTFTLFFPVTRYEKTGDQKDVLHESYMGRGESILVVDDVREQRDLAATMLSNLGYRVNSVASGEEAVLHLKTNSVDILVLDMIMEPGIDGLETYRQVLEINPKQKAIIVSGFSETDRVKKAQELGAGAYVRKPYILAKIGLAVRRELDRKVS